MSTTTTETAEPASKEKPREYGFSVLVTGFARMWRGFKPAIVVILVNAVIQALLVIGDPVFGVDGALIYLLALVSAIAIIATAAYITAIGLGAVEGKVTFRDATARVKSNLWVYLAWLIGLGIVTLLGTLLYTLPGAIISALTPFVTIAAMAGQKNALAADFKAIGARPIRWIVTLIFTALVGFVVWLIAAGNTFLITGPIAAFITVTIVGFIGLWFATAWSCLYRSTPVGALDADEASGDEVDVSDKDDKDKV